MKYATLAIIALLAGSCTSDSSEQPFPGNTNWDTYLGDPGRSHYSALTQINRGNAAQLELAWRYDSGELREGNSSMYTSPLIID